MFITAKETGTPAAGDPSSRSTWTVTTLVFPTDP